jgi:hypothetical protein
MISILDTVGPSDVIFEPYPHIVVRNALPDAYYQKLEAEFPSRDIFKRVLKQAKEKEDNNKKIRRELRHLRRSNKRVNLPSQYVLDSEAVSEEWKKFIDFHSSNAFFQQLLAVFEDAIRQHRPDVFTGSTKGLRRGLAGDEDFAIDALTSMNTPARRKGEITGPHTDHPSKLFIGLYYLRCPNDMGGGNLLLYKRNEPVTDKNLKWPSPDTVEVVYTVDYEPNTLVILLNTPASVHGVSLRDKTASPRRFMNFVAARGG